MADLNKSEEKNNTLQMYFFLLLTCCNGKQYYFSLQQRFDVRMFHALLVRINAILLSKVQV